LLVITQSFNNFKSLSLHDALPIYKFNRNFAVEGGYFNLGKFGFTAHTSPAGTLEGSAKFQGANVDAVGILPLGGNFSAFARAGRSEEHTSELQSQSNLVCRLLLEK